MAMSKRIQLEVNKGRELLWHFLEGKRCWFCKKLFVTAEQVKMIRFGNGTAPGIDLEITIHHEDENHSNNRKSNRKLSHTSCHKSHHAVKTFRAYRRAA